MDKLKATLQRAVAWAKAHPIPAAIIVLVLVVIGFLLARRATSGGGSASAETPVTIPDSMGGGFSGSSSGGSSPLFSQAAAIPTIDGSSGGSSGGGSLFDYLYTPTSPATPAFDLSSVTPAYGMSGVTQSALSAALPTTPTPITSIPALADVWQSVQPLMSGGSTPLVSVSPTGSVTVSGHSAGTIAAPAAAAPAAAAAPDTSGWSPAKILGKGQHYTGWIGPIYYNDGYPDMASSIAQGATAPVISVSPSGSVSVSGHSSGGLAAPAVGTIGSNVVVKAV